MVTDYFTYRVRQLIDRSGVIGMTVNGILFFMQMEYRQTKQQHVTAALSDLNEHIKCSDGRWRLKGHHEAHKNSTKETLKKKFAKEIDRGSGQGSRSHRATFIERKMRGT